MCFQHSFIDYMSFYLYLCYFFRYLFDAMAPPGGGKRGSFPPIGGRPKIIQYVCAFTVMELLRITRQI